MTSRFLSRSQALSTLPIRREAKESGITAMVHMSCSLPCDPWTFSFGSDENGWGRRISRFDCPWIDMPSTCLKRKQACHSLYFVFTLHLRFAYLSVEKRLGMSDATSFLPITPRTHGKHASNPFSAKIQINNNWIQAVRKNLLLGWRATAGMECMLGSAIYLKSTGMSLKYQTSRWVRCSCLEKEQIGNQKST